MDPALGMGYVIQLKDPRQVGLAHTHVELLVTPIHRLLDLQLRLLDNGLLTKNLLLTQGRLWVRKVHGRLQGIPDIPEAFSHNLTFSTPSKTTRG